MLETGGGILELHSGPALEEGSPVLSHLRSYMEGGFFVIGGQRPDKGQCMNY